MEREIGKLMCTAKVSLFELKRGHWKYIQVFIMLQVQGLEEHFIDRCGGVIKWLDSETYYTAFTEGWGLYAENPLIGEDTDTYKNEPWQKYGMLKWQVS